MLSGSLSVWTVTVGTVPGAGVGEERDRVGRGVRQGPPEEVRHPPPGEGRRAHLER